MLHLIKKDFRIHYVSWYLYVGLIVFFTLFNKDPMFIIALISSVIIMNLFYYDEESNGYKLWTSLPFRRHDIVSSRYVSLLLTMIFVTGCVLLMNRQWDLTLVLEVFGSVITILLTAALFFPIFYYFAQQRLMFFFLILYVIIVIGVVHGLYYSYLYLLKIAFLLPYLSTYS